MDSARKTPVSILCIGNEWFPDVPGGLNRYVFELIHQLSNASQVELCAFGLPNSSSIDLQLTNLGDPESSLWKRFFSARTNSFCRKITRPDAINLHFALSSFPLLQSFPDNVPITFTFHGPWVLESKHEGESWLNLFVKRWVEQRVYQRCDRFIVLSQAFGIILHETYQIPWEKINIIPGGVDIQRFQPDLTQQAARKQLGWPADRPILFTPRRLVNRMGLTQLLQAMSLVKTQVPDAWLAIAGKGPLREVLDHQVQQLDLSNHIQLLGYLPDEQLPVAYQAADLTVVPTQQLEGFGLILIESLACGTPALCTPVGGMPEIIEPLCQNLITQSIEPESIANRLIDILSGQIPLPSRTRCREYAVKHYDWQEIAVRVKQVLLA